MKKISIALVVLLSLIMIQGCTPKVDSTPKQVHFAVYKVVQDENQMGKRPAFYDSGDIGDLSDLKLEETPLFTDQDIQAYNWDEQEITFNAAYVEKKGITDKNTSLFEGGSQLVGAKYHEIGVVVLDGKLLYAFGFPMPAYSSFLPPIITMRDIGKDKVRIGCFNNKDNTLIEDKRIYDFFKAEGKLVE